MLFWNAFFYPLLHWKSNKCYIFWVCFCSINYPARNTHVFWAVLYSYVWPACFCHTFFMLIDNINEKIIGKNICWTKSCIIISSTTFVEKISARYYRKFTYVFVHSTRYSDQNLSRNELPRQIFEKIIQIPYLFYILPEEDVFFHADGQTDEEK